MRSILQGNADEVVLEVIVMRIATDARQIMLSQESCERDGFLLWRLIHKVWDFAAALLRNTVKMSGHL